MNLLLFTPAELAAPLPRADPRAAHILDVLRRREGDTFDAGLIDGPIGKATLVSLAPDGLTLTLAFTPTHEPTPLPLVTLLVGLPRPQTARDILRDATTIGVAALHFVACERTDPNYAASTLWSSGEWRRHVITGAVQAFDTRLPAITWTHTLAAEIVALPAADAAAPTPAPVRLALDNYEATAPLAAALRDRASTPALAPGAPLVLAIGPERGWGATDRETLRAAGFTLVHLGPRVLRAETAVTAALAVVHALRA